MSTPKDFDPVTNKLVPVSEIRVPEGVSFEDIKPGTYKMSHPAKEPVLANPAKLAPTGSPPAKLYSADWFRALFSGIGIYGAVTIGVQLLDYFGANPGLFPVHGAEWAAVFVAASHLVSAYMRDNTPRLP